MTNKLYLNWIFLFLIIMVINIPVFAHKVNIFAYVEGDRVYTESYFSDGKKCVDSKIEVFDNQENKLLEGLTDKEGVFSFEVSPEVVEDGDLKIVITASMGHKAEYTIRADELRDTTGLVKEEHEEPISSKEKDERAFKISPTEIIGGIGYIFGIFGIIAYFLSRKK